MEDLDIQVGKIIASSHLTISNKDKTVLFYRKDGETVFEVISEDKRTIIKI